MPQIKSMRRSKRSIRNANICKMDKSLLTSVQEKIWDRKCAMKYSNSRSKSKPKKYVFHYQMKHSRSPVRQVRRRARRSKITSRSRK